MHEACFNDFREVVPILLKAGAAVNAVNGVSLDATNVALIEPVIDRGNCKLCTQGKNTPLHLAAEQGCEQIVVMLLDAGADRTLKNRVR